jgi:hypothetical protein
VLIDVIAQVDQVQELFWADLASVKIFTGVRLHVFLKIDRFVKYDELNRSKIGTNLQLRAEFELHIARAARYIFINVINRKQMVL